MIKGTVNHWLNDQRDIFQKDSKFSEEEWKQFESELDEDELMQLESFETLISERVKQWDQQIPTMQVGDAATDYSKLIESHYLSIVKYYWHSQEDQKRNDTPDPTITTITTSPQEIELDESTYSQQRDKALTQSSQGASRKRILRQRRSRMKKRDDGMSIFCTCSYDSM